MQNSLALSILLFSSLASAQQPEQPSGKQLYQQLCAACHGVELDGKGPMAQAVFPAPANLTEHVREHSFMELMHPIMHGEGAMPSWQGSLTHEEAFSITRYLQRQNR